MDVHTLHKSVYPFFCYDLIKELRTMTVAMVWGGDREGSSVLHLIWPEQRVQTLINHSKIQISNTLKYKFCETEVMDINLGVF